MNATSIPIYNENDYEKVLLKLDPARNRACNNDLLWGLGNGDFSGNYYGTTHYGQKNTTVLPDVRTTCYSQKVQGSGGEADWDVVVWV